MVDRSLLVVEKPTKVANQWFFGKEHEKNRKRGVLARSSTTILVKHTDQEKGHFDPIWVKGKPGRHNSMSDSDQADQTGSDWICGICTSTEPNRSPLEGC